VVSTFDLAPDFFFPALRAYCEEMARGLDSGGQDEAAVLAAVTDGEGNRALHLAAAAGRVEVCRYIVEDLRLDVNQPNFKGFVLFTSPVAPIASILQLFNFYYHVKFVF
jgi:hypothetical protein